MLAAANPKVRAPGPVATQRIAGRRSDRRYGEGLLYLCCLASDTRLCSSFVCAFALHAVLRLMQCGCISFEFWKAFGFIRNEFWFAALRRSFGALFSFAFARARLASHIPNGTRSIRLNCPFVFPTTYTTHSLTLPPRHGLTPPERRVARR